MSNIYKDSVLVGIITTAIFIIFFLEALLFLGMGLPTSLIWASGFAGLVVFISFISTAIRQQLNQRAFQQKHKASNNSSHQQLSVELDLPFDTTFDLCLAGLEMLHGQEWHQPVKLFGKKQVIRIHETDRNTGEIQVGLGSRTFGIVEPYDYLTIRLKLQRMDPLTTSVEIDSKPYSNTLMYDYGMSLHIVNALALYLRRESIHKLPPIRLAETQEFAALEDVDPKEMRYGGW